MTLPTVTVAPHAHKAKMEMPANLEEFLAMVSRIFSVKDPAKMLKPMVMNNWNFGTPGLKEIVLDDIRVRPFQQSEDQWLSATKVLHALRAEGRRPLNGLESLPLARAIEKGEIKLPAPCHGIHLLGAGMGKRLLVMRKTKHGDWEFGQIPSSHIKGFAYASCKA